MTNYDKHFQIDASILSMITTYHPNNYYIKKSFKFFFRLYLLKPKYTPCISYQFKFDHPQGQEAHSDQEYYGHSGGAP